MIEETVDPNSDYPVLAIESIHDDSQGMPEDEIWLRWDSQPDLLEACQEMIEAFVQYEMGVNDEDIQPTYAHRDMMKKARAAVAQATAV